MESLSLRELCELIRLSIEHTMPERYWVRAEIASLSQRGGHAYFDLVDKGQDAQMAAKVRATCWASTYHMLSAYFREESGQMLQTGMQILVEVEVNFHPVYGLSLNILNIDPTYTIGELARQRQETLRRLQEEGVMELQHELSLPTLVRRLAVVSSPQAAGYEDFVHQLESAVPGYFHIALYPALMQGEQSAMSIIHALDTIYGHMDDYDAVVIIRGGGATTDLSSYDNYDLASHAAQFPLPIITGIGHTRDMSILDMVAYLSLKTPTAVAAYFLDRLMKERDRLMDLRTRLLRTADRQIMLRRHQLELLSQRLESCSPERIFARGYSLVTHNGQVVKSVHELKKGEVMETHLKDGVVVSVVERT